MVMVTVVVAAVISGQFSCVSLFFSLVFCLICGVATCTNSSNISIIRECLHCVCVCEFSLCPRCLERLLLLLLLQKLVASTSSSVLVVFLSSMMAIYQTPLMKIRSRNTAAKGSEGLYSDEKVNI